MLSPFSHMQLLCVSIIVCPGVLFCSFLVKLCIVYDIKYPFLRSM